MIYCAWVGVDESFNAQCHSREDIKIISLLLDHREADYPTVVIRCPVMDVSTYQGRRCFLSVDGELLFQGYVHHGVPIQTGDDLMDIELSGQPLDSEAQVQVLMEPLKVSPLWDPLFVEVDHHNDPVEVLDARSSVIEWDAKSLKAHVVDIFHGLYHRDMTDFFHGSFVMKRVKDPLERVDVVLHAHWIQKHQGSIDAAPLIEGRFGDGMINSFTGERLKVKWWLKGEHMGRSGYTVLDSHMQDAPAHTGDMWVPFTPRDDAAIYIKRHWLKGQLTLGWTYHQRRHETVRFQLRNNLQRGVPSGGVKKLSITLQNVAYDNNRYPWVPGRRYTVAFRVLYEGDIYSCVEAHTSSDLFQPHLWQKVEGAALCPDQEREATFFLTHRGKQALHHGIEVAKAYLDGIEVAKAYLAGSTRAVEMSVKGSFDGFKDLSPLYAVTIRDGRIPGGVATGKIVHHQLCVDGPSGKRWGQITMAVSVGVGSLESYPSVGEVTPSGIYVQPYDHQRPTKGLTVPDTLTVDDMVEDVQIVNGPEDQWKALEGCRTRKEVLETLQANGTDIQVRLKDIRTSTTLTHDITVELPYGWSGPRHIDVMEVNNAR